MIRDGRPQLEEQYRALCVQGIDDALQDAALHNDLGITVCRGRAKGCYGKGAPCPECVVVNLGDLQTGEQVVSRIERGDG